MSTPLITLYPSFYSRFACKAGDCVHSCCVQDWEIDIDDDTAALYQSMDGPLGEEIRQSMRKNEETYYWDMKDGKCPFLNKQGLCRIVLKKGEGALCDICAMHPRFFVCAGNLSTIFYEQLLSHYEKTEPINAAWTASLLHMKTHVQKAADRVHQLLEEIPSSHLTRIYQYILYRGLEKAEIYGLPAVMAYARESVDFILLATAFYGDFPEQVRLWSEQIEYDTENVDRLLSLLSGQ